MGARVTGPLAARTGSLLAIIVLLLASGAVVVSSHTEAAVAASASPAQSSGGGSLQGCVVDATDFLGWWKGEDNLTAEVGPDLTGTVAYADAVVGRGMSFGSNDVVGVDGFPAVSTGVTVETWVKPAPTFEPQSIIARWKLVGTDGDSAYAIRLIGNTLVWATDDLSTLRPVELTASVPQLRDGSFHHIAGTWSVTSISLYVDGVAVASRPSQGGLLNAATNTALRLGSSAGIGDPFFFTGELDEPAIFRRALTPEEINAIYTAGAGGKCNPAPPADQLAKLTAADGAPNDWFGRAVAIDGNTAIVGAPATASGGAAYVYTHSGTTWSMQAKLVAADEASGDSFGFSVAISGDTAVVGSFQNDPASGSGHVLNAGAVYVFTRTGTTWTQQAKLTAPNPQAVDFFGRAVDISGSTIVVGVLFADDLGSNSGAVYVFTRTGTTWTQQAKLLATDGVAGDGFGYSVAVNVDTVVVGADLQDALGSDSGAAYIFTRTGTTWTPRTKLLASDGAAADHFGTAVDVEGGTVIVGAPEHDGVATDAGATYVFTGSGSSWAQQAELTASDAAADDHLGFSVAISRNTVVAGAYGDSGNGTNSGSTSVFTRPSTTWGQVGNLLPMDPSAQQLFGVAVALSNGIAVIGANGDNNQQGAAYVFDP